MSDDGLFGDFEEKEPEQLTKEDTERLKAILEEHSTVMTQTQDRVQQVLTDRESAVFDLQLANIKLSPPAHAAFTQLKGEVASLMQLTDAEMWQSIIEHGVASMLKVGKTSAIHEVLCLLHMQQAGMPQEIFAGLAVGKIKQGIAEYDKRTDETFEPSSDSVQIMNFSSRYEKEPAPSTK